MGGGFSRGALDRWTAAIRRWGVTGPSGATVVGAGLFWNLDARCGAPAAAEWNQTKFGGVNKQIV